MVGLRAPAYEKAADRKAYWAQLRQIMESACNRAILFAGDISFDPIPPGNGKCHGLGK